MIKPNGHKVIVKPDDIEEVTEGGIVLTGVINERLEKAGINRGILVAYGNQAWRAFSNDFTGMPWANVGDYVLYSKYAGKLIQDPIDGTEYMIMNDEDVLAVITEGSNHIPENPVVKKLRKEGVTENV